MEARENKTDELFSSVSLHLSQMFLFSPSSSRYFLIFLFLLYFVSPFFAPAFFFSLKPPPQVKAGAKIAFKYVLY